MTDQSSSLEQTVAHHSAAIAQINEILLLIARRQQESDRVQQETDRIQRENAQQIVANTQQIAANAQAIAELRATIQDHTVATDNEESNHAMTDQSSQLKQTVANYNTEIARSKEILLLIAACQQESDRIQQETIQIQQANAQQIAANAQAIAELRATIQDRYGGNEQRGE